jgi:pimeloyl-ACP methyl ester carboxylesterase
MTDTTSYIEHPCTLDVPGWSIPAMLSLPGNYVPGKTLPSAILLVPGSLFSDVNGDFPAWNSYPHVYAHLAHRLSALGHAVYRYAKLGPGTGSVEVPSDSPIGRTWEGRHQITAAAFAAMRRELAEREIVVERLIGAGHSEGSVAVSVLATSSAGNDLDGVVLLAGPSIGILGIMREQAGIGVEPSQVDGIRARLDVAIEHVRRGEPVPMSLVDGGGMGVGALASMPEEGRRYMRDVDATDPTELVREIRKPLLIVQGGNDMSVPTHHGERLRDAGRAGATYLFVPNVTHMFKVVPEGLSPQEEFGYPGETDARVTDGIDEWIRGG